MREPRSGGGATGFSGRDALGEYWECDAEDQYLTDQDTGKDGEHATPGQSL